jgi:polygalacturonase
MRPRHHLNNFRMLKLARTPVLALMTLLFTASPIWALKRTDIKTAGNSTHIARIHGDTIVVIAGRTFLFTVDTPEDSGLTSTETTVALLLEQIASADGAVQQYKVTDAQGSLKTAGTLLNGDRLIVASQDGKSRRTYHIKVAAAALSGSLELLRQSVTVETPADIGLSFRAGQRSPNATVRFYLPAGIHATMDNITVNIIGRGTVRLKDLERQSIGRTGHRYPYRKVGEAAITAAPGGGSIITLRHLDLRPANGADVLLTIENVRLPRAGNYPFRAAYTTSAPDTLSSAGTGPETAVLAAVGGITDFARVLDKSLPYKETADTYTKLSFTWSRAVRAGSLVLMQSPDSGRSWSRRPVTIDPQSDTLAISGLEPGRLHAFRLWVKEGPNKGFSNTVYFYSGKMDIKNFGLSGEDNTERINEAISYLSRIGGGTLLFSKGEYAVRTVHLKSNVYLYIEKDATIKALKGADAPEATWFSDRKYRSGLSPTDTGPYDDPENYLTKQDVGHHYFRNAMFFGERLDNVKIIGNGLITGNGNLATGDNVMKNAPGSRADKMFVLKLCSNLEIGGLYRGEDLWYNPEKDEPFYKGRNDLDNMLHIDRAGHFVLLATGTDNIYVHNTYFGKHNTANARDIYDFMGCNNVTALNIYSKVSSDDIIKPGSDCSLGFTRPARNYKVRNIIGDTNCNLFQIGSETADDITDICVDNIYVLGANKAGFSISTNDGGHVKNIHLNCGHTGPIHARSKMYRTFAPFFISISNRARILGAEAGKYSFTENGRQHHELLVKNVNIGEVENIIINGIDIAEVYGGSSFRGGRWKAYDGSQKRTTSIIAGYRLPDSLGFTLPNGKHTGYIRNVVFNDVHITDKGGNPLADVNNTPAELGVGQYNASNLKTLPAYGLWARHVAGLTVKGCSFNYEKRDSRYALFLEDVSGSQITGVKMVRAKDNDHVIQLKHSGNVSIKDVVYYDDEWERSPEALPLIDGGDVDAVVGFPAVK